MKSLKLKIFTGILIVCTLVVAYLHLTTREVVSDHSLKIVYHEKEIYVDLEKIDYIEVSGIRVNGKGEEITVSGLGIEMKTILEEQEISDYSSVNVISDDSYQVEVKKNEIDENKKVYLMFEEDLRLIVFGDSNSKRSVSHVVQLEIK